MKLSLAVILTTLYPSPIISLQLEKGTLKNNFYIIETGSTPVYSNQRNQWIQLKPQETLTDLENLLNILEAELQSLVKLKSDNVLEKTKTFAEIRNEHLYLNKPQDYKTANSLCNGLQSTLYSIDDSEKLTALKEYLATISTSASPTLKIEELWQNIEMINGVPFFTQDTNQQVPRKLENMTVVINLTDNLQCPYFNIKTKTFSSSSCNSTKYSVCVSNTQPVEAFHYLVLLQRVSDVKTDLHASNKRFQYLLPTIPPVAQPTPTAKPFDLMKINLSDKPFIFRPAISGLFLPSFINYISNKKQTINAILDSIETGSWHQLLPIFTDTCCSNNKTNNTSWEPVLSYEIFQDESTSTLLLNLHIGTDITNFTSLHLIPLDSTIPPNTNTRFLYSSKHSLCVLDTCRSHPCDIRSTKNNTCCLEILTTETSTCQLTSTSHHLNYSYNHDNTEIIFFPTSPVNISSANCLQLNFEITTTTLLSLKNGTSICTITIQNTQLNISDSFVISQFSADLTQQILLDNTSPSSNNEQKPNPIKSPSTSWDLLYNIIIITGSLVTILVTITTSFFYIRKKLTQSTQPAPQNSTDTDIPLRSILRTPTRQRSTNSRRSTDSSDSSDSTSS